MLARLLFFSAVAAATLAVVLLAAIHRAGVPHPAPAGRQLSLSLYLHAPRGPPRRPPARGAALVFRHALTAGRSRAVVGSAQGFVVPTAWFARSPFNVICFSIDDPGGGLRGTIGVDARDLKGRRREEVGVVGGTGAFAFAQGKAVLWRMDGWDRTLITYGIRIMLSLPSDRTSDHHASANG